MVPLAVVNSAQGPQGHFQLPKATLTGDGQMGGPAIEAPPQRAGSGGPNLQQAHEQFVHPLVRGGFVARYYGEVHKAAGEQTDALVQRMLVERGVGRLPGKGQKVFLTQIAQRAGR